MDTKIVKAKSAIDTAKRLEIIKRKKAKLQDQLRNLEAEELFLRTNLELKYGSGFMFPSGKYWKRFESKVFDREILDQSKAKLLLGKKAPMKTIKVHTHNIDFVYYSKD